VIVLSQSGNEVQIPNALVAWLTVCNGDDTRRRRRRIAEAQTQSLNFLFNQGFFMLSFIATFRTSWLAATLLLMQLTSKFAQQ